MTLITIRKGEPIQSHELEEVNLNRIALWFFILFFHFLLLVGAIGLVYHYFKFLNDYGIFHHILNF